MFDVDNIRKEFPILQRKVYGRDLVYLDSGATAQKPLAVIEKVNQLHSFCNANIHRGVHFMSNACTDEYEAARSEVAAWINAPSDKTIVFTSGATASINLVAYSYGELLQAGDEIIVSQMEHHSNIVPWQLLAERRGVIVRMLPFDEKGDLMQDVYDQLLTEKTKLVAITATSNVLGSCPPLKEMIDKAHDLGAKVLIDGCQGIVHAPVDVVALDCDFYAFSGHKFYGPTGIGVLYAKEALLERMPPYMGGGDMVAHVSFKKTTYAQLPLKFEAGTSNYIGAIGLGEAIRFVKKLDITQIAQHEHLLLIEATTLLKQIDGLRIYGESDTKCSIVSFGVEGVHPMDMGMILDKMGVAVRTGTHCAEPVMARYGISSMVRASMAMYNTLEEVGLLYRAVDTAVGMLR